MAEVVNFTDPLSGTAIVEDVLGQIRRRLATDCNLRGTDGYSGGYSGEVTIKLRCHAVRIAVIDMEFPISQSADVKAPGSDAFPPEDIEKVEIDEKIEISLEPNLNLVRERTIENKAENLETETAVPENEENLAIAPHTKRKYTRRAALVGAVAGE